MKIHGFNKLTLLDYPGHVGATLFLGGCNFRCPYCQNGNLVTAWHNEPWIPEDEVLSYLKKRQGILEGVCISGGEPTLHSELPDFIRKIKDLGYLVKLDTNGSNPMMIKELHHKKLIDFVAMDIKTSLANYTKITVCTGFKMNLIEESVEFLLSGQVDYEFRTTVVKELHTKEDFEAIAYWLEGCRAYYLQAFRSSDHVLTPGLSSYTKDELNAFQKILQAKIPRVELRGID